MEEVVRRQDHKTMTIENNSASAPRGVPARAIEERQLEPDMIRLQRAAARSHQLGQRLEAIRVTASVLLAVAGIVTTLLDQGRTAVTILGAVWFLASVFLLRRASVTSARQGALLQEMFDTELFYLPWRSAVAGVRVADADVSRLARSLRQGSGKAQRIDAGWYDPTAGVHHPYDVLIAQEQNLGWDARLRRLYANLVLALAVLWTLAGLVAGMVIANSTIVEVIVSFFVPSLAVYQLAAEIWYGQRQVADERERLRCMVTTELQNAQPGTISEPEWSRLHNVAREIQDGILRTRFDAARVPEWLYKTQRTNDEHDFGETAEAHRLRLKST
jgi:hypothetical protein